MKRQSIYTEGLEEYINSELIPRPFRVFDEMEKTALQENFPILSPMAGQVLSFLVKEFSPKNILEIGTGFGYSLLWMLSSGVQFKKILTMDRSPESIQYAKRFINREISDTTNIEFLNDWAVEYLEKNPGTLKDSDFIFVDCDKVCYPDLLGQLEQNCNQGSAIVFDNVLWHGRILDNSLKKPSDIAIRSFWAGVKKSALKSTLFPVGDGLLLLQKI